MAKIKCPICHQKFETDESENMPFCSRRCQQVDLSRWLGEEYGLPVEGQEEAEAELIDDEEL